MVKAEIDLAQHILFCESYKKILKYLCPGIITHQSSVADGTKKKTMPEIWILRKDGSISVVLSIIFQYPDKFWYEK